MSKVKRLELTWIGKEQKINPEPRILLYDSSQSHGDQNTGNMLIHGDNLLALKALELEFAGKVKCAYADVPFNTGQAFEHYDDNVEHSIWLNLMKPRLEITRRLLSDDGALYLHIDDQNLGYMSVLLDEVFGRSNRLYTITFKQGAATGHKAINPGCVTTTNFILMYAKSKQKWTPNKVYTARERDNRYSQFITNPVDGYKNWKIITLMSGLANSLGITEKEARAIVKDNPSVIDNFVISNCEQVIRYAKPDYNNVGANVRDAIDQSAAQSGEVIHLQREQHSDMYFVSGQRILFYKDKLKLIDGNYISGEPLTTLWDDLLSNNLHNEGGVAFPKGKKPEALIKRILELSTNPGDLVLDSFLGSGTTAAVAHKMGRRWIGIELGDHCYTHCVPRMKAVIDGEQGGISKAVSWEGGGGYRFLELAETLLTTNQYGHLIVNPKYNATMLAAAMAKVKGYQYSPDPQFFWKQGRHGQNNFIFTTTMFMSPEYLDMIALEMAEDERLLVCCEAFDEACRKRQKRITIQKIPRVLLGRCEFGRDSYDLNVVLQDVTDDEC